MEDQELGHAEQQAARGNALYAGLLAAAASKRNLSRESFLSRPKLSGRTPAHSRSSVMEACQCAAGIPSPESSSGPQPEYCTPQGSAPVLQLRTAHVRYGYHATRASLSILCLPVVANEQRLHDHRATDDRDRGSRTTPYSLFRAGSNAAPKATAVSRRRLAIARSARAARTSRQAHRASLV